MLVKCDTSLLLRAFSIFVIVANHFEFLSLIGGALYLIGLSGFNFVKFTLVKFESVSGYPQTLSFSRFFHIYYRFVGKLILPTCLYILFIYIVIGKFYIFGLLLVSNFIGPDYAGGLSYWFLEVLIQIYILFSLMFLIKPLRVMMAEKPFECFFRLSLLSYIVARLCLFIFDTHDLLNRLPHLLLYIFILGALVASSKTIKQKLLTTGLATMICAEQLILNFGNMITFMYLALLATLWISTITIPKVLYIPVRLIALSSLFIYLSHFQTHRFLEKAFGAQAPVVSVLAALVVGILLSTGWKHRGNIWQKLIALISRNFDSKNVQ